MMFKKLALVISIIALSISQFGWAAEAKEYAAWSQGTAKSMVDATNAIQNFIDGSRGSAKGANLKQLYASAIARLEAVQKSFESGDSYDQSHFESVYIEPAFETFQEWYESQKSLLASFSNGYGN